MSQMCEQIRSHWRHHHRMVVIWHDHGQQPPPHHQAALHIPTLGTPTHTLPHTPTHTHKIHRFKFAIFNRFFCFRFDERIHFENFQKYFFQFLCPQHQQPIGKTTKISRGRWRRWSGRRYVKAKLLRWTLSIVGSWTRSWTWSWSWASIASLK